MAVDKDALKPGAVVKATLPPYGTPIEGRISKRERVYRGEMLTVAIKAGVGERTVRLRPGCVTEIVTPA